MHRSLLGGDLILETNDDQYPILCPKPRHTHSSPILNFLKPPPPPPPYTTKHSHLAAVGDRSNEGGVLNLQILDNNKDDNQPQSSVVECNKEIRGRETSTLNCWCVSWCYSGSPPGRTENPLVHDVRFIRQQMELISPLTQTN